MCLDKAVYYYGEKLAMHVVITNSSNRTIRKIKCKLYQVSQLSFTTGERRAPLYCLETTEGCPIPPGATLQRVRRSNSSNLYFGDEQFSNLLTFVDIIVVGLVSLGLFIQLGGIDLQLDDQTAASS